MGGKTEVIDALGMDVCVQVPLHGWIQEWVSLQLCF